MKQQKEQMYDKKGNNSYYTNKHSCFLLQYHLVLVTKYRHPVIEAFTHAQHALWTRTLPVLIDWTAGWKIKIKNAKIKTTAVREPLKFE